MTAFRCSELPSLPFTRTTGLDAWREERESQLVNSTMDTIDLIQVPYGWQATPISSRSPYSEAIRLEAPCKDCNLSVFAGLATVPATVEKGTALTDYLYDGHWPESVRVFGNSTLFGRTDGASCTCVITRHLTATSVLIVEASVTLISHEWHAARDVAREIAKYMTAVHGDAIDDWWGHVPSGTGGTQ